MEKYRIVWGPEGQIVSQKLHDQSTVLVWLLTQSVQLRDSLVKSL